MNAVATNYGHFTHQINQAIGMSNFAKNKGVSYTSKTFSEKDYRSGINIGIDTIELMRRGRGSLIFEGKDTQTEVSFKVYGNGVNVTCYDVDSNKETNKPPVPHGFARITTSPSVIKASTPEARFISFFETPLFQCLVRKPSTAWNSVTMWAPSNPLDLFKTIQLVRGLPDAPVETIDFMHPGNVGYSIPSNFIKRGFREGLNTFLGRFRSWFYLLSNQLRPTPKSK